MADHTNAKVHLDNSRWTVEVVDGDPAFQGDGTLVDVNLGATDNFSGASVNVSITGSFEEQIAFFEGTARALRFARKSDARIEVRFED
jgi:hypothetical protein